MRTLEKSRSFASTLLLIRSNAHLWTCEQEAFCFFERSYGRFTRDGRKSLEKVFECPSAFQVVEQRLDRHSRSAKNIPVFDDDFQWQQQPNKEII